jgi:hypothetical protein
MVKQRFSNQNQRGKVSTAPLQQHWSTLEQTLQASLRQQWLKSQPLQIRCAVREGTLLVLAEHLLHVEPDPEVIFTSLEAAIRVLLPEALQTENAALQLSNELRVQLLLRISGYQQPYASRIFCYISDPSPCNIHHFSAAASFAASLNSTQSVSPPSSASFGGEAFGGEAAVKEPTQSVPKSEAQSEAQIIDQPAQVTDVPTDGQIDVPEIVEPIVEPIVELEAPESSVTQSEIVESNVAELAVIEPKIVELNPIELAANEREEVELKAVEPKIVETATIEPQIVERNNTELTITESKLSQAEITEPRRAELFELEELQVNDAALQSTTQTIDLEAARSDVSPDISSQSSQNLGSSNLSEETRLFTEGAIVEPTFEPVINIEETRIDAELKTVIESDVVQAEIQDSREDSPVELDSVRQIEVNPIEPVEQFKDEFQSHQLIEKSESVSGVVSTATTEEILEELPLSTFASQSIEQFDHHPSESNLELIRQSASDQTESLRLQIPEFNQQHQVQDEPKLEAIQNDTVHPYLLESAQEAQTDRVSQPKTPEPIHRRSFRWTASSLGLTSAVGGFILVNSVYILSRPCVIGNCEPLRQATQLSQAAIQTAQTTTSALAVVEAYKQLNEASYLLATIPVWSRHHTAAQTLLNSYEDQAVVLGKVVNALEQANTAAQKSQNPPHPLPEWREIQWLWRDVIAQLEQIPSSSALYPLVQRKLQEYRNNLAGIDQRVGIEQQAQDRINAARQAGQAAEARIGSAQTAAHWQEVAATWTAAIAQLRQIPPSTMVYDEAQQLLAIYQPKLTQANTRQNQELVAAKAYAQALDAAAQAHTSEQQNQWSQATARWQSALTHARQVPSSTSYHTQIQPLIGTYTQMLQQATQNAQRSTAIQTIQPSLGQACPSAAKICSYTVSPQAIRVQFTSTYDRTVSLAVNNQQPTDQSNSSNILDQVNGSLRILADISETTQVPIELYDANGAKVGTYAPSLSGYVPQ